MPVIVNGQVVVELPDSNLNPVGNVYYLGSFSGNNLVFSEDFKELENRGLKITQSNYTDKNIQQSLEFFVAEKGMKPLVSLKTEANQLNFEPTEPGLYGIIYDKKKIGNNVYQFRSSFFNFNNQNLSFEIKPDKISVEAAEQILVRVRWLNIPAKDRPEYISLSLFSLGELLRTQTLDQNNLWSFAFTNLNPEQLYGLMLELPAGFAYRIRSVGAGQYVLEIYRTTASDPSKLEDPKSTGSQVKTDSIYTGKIRGDADDLGQKPDDELKAREEKLPYTGQLWWPVPLLIFAGLILFLLSILGEENEEN